MKKFIRKIAIFAAFAVASVFLCGSSPVLAAEGSGISVSISPVSDIIQLTGNMNYEKVFKVSNNGSAPMTFQVYASPFTYTFDETNSTSNMNFSNENNYTQIVRWIRFKDTSGNFVEKATFTADPGASVEVTYQINTPESIPAGGQYAVIFAHVQSGSSNTSGIKAEARPGLTIYGRSSGDTKISGASSDLQILQTKTVENEQKSIINATSMVENTGNVDFTASGKLKVKSIFGTIYYETPANSTRARTSIIPEAKLTVSDSWDDTAYFGLFNVEWTVFYGSGESATVSRFILLLPAPIVVAAILLLTFITIWIIIIIRKRKERRARFMV